MTEEEYYKRHLRKIEEYELKIRNLYKEAINEVSIISKMVPNFDPSKPFIFSDYPIAKARADKVLSEFQAAMEVLILSGITTEWNLSNTKNNDVIKTAYPSIKGDKYFNPNTEALEAFKKRKFGGLGISQRVWNYTNQFKGEIEMALDIGIREGTSANNLAKDLRAYLREPDKLFRKVRNEHGQLVLSKNAKNYHPGQGVYRSSYKNARRLAATEINIAYRAADHERWSGLDFVMGQEIKLSNNHTLNGKPFVDICDHLAGRYPKDFKFVGWHPLCYDNQTELLTDRGWLPFKDVTTKDKALSLNPDTRNVEWANIILSFGRKHKGEMVHFHNNTLSCVVTPEHEMVYLNKSDGRIKRTTAKEFTKGKGAFYRSADWVGSKVDNIKIGTTELNFNDFCEFMGYWLSDGSTIRTSQIVIAQQDGDPNKQNIIDCISNLGFKHHTSFDKVCFYNRDLCNYLKQFGISYQKFIPKEIKNSSIEQIQIFLDAFISCDGHIRKPKPFMGNRGTMCVPKEGEREYFTTSKQMESDLGEMILKAGKRPSYHVAKTAGKRHEFKNGTYTINHDHIRISECKAKTATVFEKEIIEYDGMVYDVTLDINSIMYIRRNGKCFWGSNCRCYSTSILLPEQQFIEQLGGKDFSSKQIKETPSQFKDWVSENKTKIQSSSKKGKLPYFLKDNKSHWR